MMQWDVFISHANEDKDSFVRPLAVELQKNGLRVWYDEFSLKLGDSLNESINKGLSESQFGIVVLSQSFFEKKWPRRELDGLVAREITEGKVILPLWHEVDHAEVAKYSPVLADRVAIETSKGVSEVVTKVLDVVQPVPARILSLTQRSLNNLRHELLSPVDAILTQIEWIESHVDHLTKLSDWEAERVRLKFEDIKQNAMLIDVLATTMAGFGENTHLKMRQFSLGQTIQTCIGFLRNEARGKKIRIVVEPLGIPKIKGDQLQLTRAFYHLLRNAIKYSDPDEKEKYIRISASQERDYIVLYFKDNGIGIIKGEEEVIFQMLSRGSNTIEVFPGGTGLGLYYCRAIIRRHGGFIGVERDHLSKPTVMVVRLPENLQD
jgi:signal transduction histidine kinase